MRQVEDNDEDSLPTYFSGEPLVSQWPIPTEIQRPVPQFSVRVILRNVWAVVFVAYCRWRPFLPF
jgi:hypothetical protein